MNIPMKKFLASSVFLLVFAAYAVYQNFGNASATYTAQPATPAPSQETPGNGPVAEVTPPPSQTPVQTAPAPVTTATPTPTPAPTPAPKPQGQYVNGTYTGDAANAYWGDVQVQVSVSGGKIADVQFVQYPSDHSTSVYINDQAMPILKSEAIQAQSAQVNGVSGASYTSAAFQESLASALSQAKS